MGAAIEYLRTLKTTEGLPLTGQRIGLYGIDLGSYAALDAASRHPEVRAMALDSMPASPDDLVRYATAKWSGMKSPILHQFARVGVKVYGIRKYQTTPSCDLARSLRNMPAGAASWPA